MNGWLLLDKPEGITSNKALMILKKLLKPKKLGHAGTLDPFATGLLLVAFGEATKTVDYAMHKDKSYEFEITWGETRDSHDRDGKVIAHSNKVPTEIEIASILPSFIGKIEQTPPVYSAIKIAGKRACDLAREGKEPELKSRIVIVYDLKLLSHSENKSIFAVKCSKGFYIRALVRDIADRLSTCGYTSSLRRTSIGKFDINNAISLDYIEKIVHNGAIEDINNAILPVEVVLDDILVQQVTPLESQKLRFGQFISSTDGLTGECIAAMQDNKIVALCYDKQGYLYPRKVFNH